MLKFFLQYAKGSTAKLILSISLSTLTILSTVGLMGVSAYLIILAGFHPSLSVLQISIVGVRFFGISRSVFRYLERLVSHNVNFEILGIIRINLFDHMSENFSKIMDRYNFSELFTIIIHDIDQIEDLFVRIISPWLAAFIVSLLIGLFFGLHSLEVMYVYLLGFFIVAVILPNLSRKNSEKTKNILKEVEDNFSHSILNFHQFLSESVFYNAESKLKLDMNEKAEKYYSKQRTNYISEAIWNNLSFLIIQLIFLSLLIISSIMANEGKLETIMVGVISLVALSSFEIVANIPANAYQYSELNNSINQISNIKNIKSSYDDSNTLTLENIFPIGFTNVTYRYHKQNTSFELRNINLEINKGEKIAIIGPNGSGKSTLIDLLSGNREDFSGSIKFDNISIEKISRKNLREKINLLSSSPFFFNTTIRKNLLLAKKNADDSELIDVLKKVSLYNPPEIDLETMLDELGKNLSTGELQRLGFAQLLLRNGDLIILDEPYSNLDPEIILNFQKIIQESFNQKAMILITHDYSKLWNIDKRIIMDNGRIKNIISGNL